MEQTELKPELTREHGFRVLAARLLVGLLQGVALYLLFQTEPAGHANDLAAQLRYGLYFVAWFIPPVAVLGLGTLRLRPLALWVAAATAAVAAIGVYAKVREAPGAAHSSFSLFQAGIALVPGLFVATVLVTDGLIERKPFPSYERHFDTASKYALQLAMALAFVGVFHGALMLGAELFRLVGVAAFGELITKGWFSFPSSTVAAAFAIHATDAAPTILRGIRSLALGLLSWLLPLFALIIAAFLGRLLFTSLAPLWALEYPTGLLLAAALFLVFLINCQYQDGSVTATSPLLRRAACALAIVELSPLVALTAWALGRHVAPYGWTVGRIFVLAATVLAGTYAIGYATALIRSWRHPNGIEATNVVSAYLSVAMIVALSSPLADPARLMVDSQIARLMSGTVRADQFDYAVLHDQGERWGQAALAKLAAAYAGPDAATVRRRAAAVIAGASVRPRPRPSAAPAGRSKAVAHVRFSPAGAELPPDFVEQIGTAQQPKLDCLRPNGGYCFARLLAIGSEPAAFLVVLDDEPGVIDVFMRDPQGTWNLEGQTQVGLLAASACKELARGALERNRVFLVPHSLPDVIVDGRPFSVHQSGTDRVDVACTPSWGSPNATARP